MKSIFFNDAILNVEKQIISGLGIPSIILMENAGANSAEYILKNYGELLKSGAVIIAGKGNNAGDGFVLARHLSINKIYVKVLMLYGEKELKGDALTNFLILKNLKSSGLKIVSCKNVSDLRKEISPEIKLLVDAVFGVGFKGEPDKKISSIISEINNLKDKKIISLDTPSCLVNYNQEFNPVKSDVTLSMGARKFQSLFYKGKEYSGKIETIGIGIPQELFDKYNTEKMYLTELSDMKKLIPKRKFDSNKYTNGKVFIITGSPGLTGASYLSSMSALKSGAGAVIAGIPESLNEIMELKLTEVMTIPLKETGDSTISLSAFSEIKKKIRWSDVTLIGPGISRNEETAELIRKIIKEVNCRYIIDADGINAFKDNIALLKEKEIIITPHYGEFSNLTGISVEDIKNNFYKIAKEFSDKYKIILLLKNAPSIITDGKRFVVNPTGKENLATAGSGDVLSGIIAGLFSVMKDPFNSAAAGAFIHGYCGDILYEKYGNDGAIAGDLIDEIGKTKSLINAD